ncbi:MAG: class I SAM-dependent methyltransferase, partial [Actinomycetes bacterium]
FRDPVAADLIGEPGAEMVGYHRRSGDHIVLAGTRTQVTVRSRWTERRLAELADGGLDQYVILGAGLDSFAYRSPLVDRMRVFEVDHPATQRWKRDLLAAASSTPPDGLTFVGVDLETDPLPDRLAAEGFDLSRPALVSWLGVSMYLTADAVAATLTRSAAWPPAPSWSWSTPCRPSCATRPARPMPTSPSPSPRSAVSPGAASSPPTGCPACCKPTA